MNGYERRTKAKKEAIINAARELFSERGVTNVGIGEIAKKAKVSQVTIYNYFGDKNTLASEALAFYIDDAIREFEVILEREVPFSEKLKSIVEIKHDMMLEVSSSYFSKHAWEDKTLREILNEAATKRAIHLYAGFIELGKNEGAIDQSIPSDAVLSYFLSSISVMQNPKFFKTSSEYKTGFLKLFLYGIIGKEH
ncbi:TetR/AcrR family transcriptional regulator [Proteiniborus sp. MB09-C3]|uniref:TetR/AcrR family transcriptional regulator n=1 Tax=Proteiniborus sp. MB09-C3 TaxID=3050072 RepID=UPI002557BDBE|nr:TetR/AcrR family transcriptional regulator [Proteiniborus sp. MB09-C3]WIV13672.1 TetR/AcrR family transcriptional regulator [Proteiniborus sp. MB09-C3]